MKLNTSNSAISDQQSTNKSSKFNDLIKKDEFQSLCITDLNFSYDSNHLFKDFSFTLLANKKVAIVGTSGSGKSTLLDIILGLRTPSSATIYIDGKCCAASNLSSEEWWSKLTYVPQGFYLTGDTIIENIAFGIPVEDINFDKVAKALYLSMLNGFVESLPHGLDTEVGENGSLLSGGQKQRLSIARALYFHEKDKILIFDEATSALDKNTENTILARLIQELNPTFVCVTHRLETLSYFDDIIHLEP